MKTTGVRPEAFARSISSVSVGLVVLAIGNLLAKLSGNRGKGGTPGPARSRGRNCLRIPLAEEVQLPSPGEHLELVMSAELARHVPHMSPHRDIADPQLVRGGEAGRTLSHQAKDSMLGVGDCLACSFL